MMHRMVNGKRVEITPEEEQQIRAEWAAKAAEKAAEKPKPTIEERLAALEAKAR